MSRNPEQDAPPLILVVEDEVLIAMEMEDRVRALGYGVLGPAPSVAGANSLLDTTAPQAALLDVQLRGESVAPVAARLRQLGIPFALVTGYARLVLDDPELATALRVSKPASEAELAAILQRMLRHSDDG